MTGAVMQPRDVYNRREALVIGLGLGCSCAAAQAQGQPQSSVPERSLRPLAGDTLVRAVGLSENSEPLRPEDIVEAAAQVMAWPRNPANGVLRDGSRLNQVLLLRLDPESLDAETQVRSAGGVVAYSSTCTHAQCPVSEWRKETGFLHCPCHGSEFDPRAGGRVVNGPALRRLPPLPLRISASGCLEVAQPFVGKVGGQVA